MSYPLKPEASVTARVEVFRVADASGYLLPLLAEPFVWPVNESRQPSAANTTIGTIASISYFIVASNSGQKYLPTVGSHNLPASKEYQSRNDWFVCYQASSLSLALNRARRGVPRPNGRLTVPCGRSCNAGNRACACSSLRAQSRIDCDTISQHATLLRDYAPHGSWRLE